MTMRETYAFDQTGPHTSEQLATLERFLDPLTIGVLERVTLPPTARCLELGAGGGSVARWLCDRVQPPGHIVAVDLDTSHLTPTDTIEVRRHDLRDSLPDGGPFDLIHARLVLLHLPHRRRLLRQLVQRLAPGGWLVLGDFSNQPLSVLTAPHEADAVLFGTVLAALTRVLTGHGADLEWARQIHPAMVEAGLVEVHTVEHAESWRGGGPGARLHHLNSLQAAEELRRHGVSDTDLEQFRALVDDPRFTARSWHFVCTRGQRPVGKPPR
jgi:2-polyprenyl-3-methyl-5-hydroxy-6-metoxy-1,4-benzoquinol methylase